MSFLPHRLRHDRHKGSNLSTRLRAATGALLLVPMLLTVVPGVAEAAPHGACKPVSPRGPGWSTIDNPMSPMPLVGDVPLPPVLPPGDGAPMGLLRVDPSDPKHIYVASNLDVMHSRDGGCTWELSYSIQTDPTVPMRRCGALELTANSLVGGGCGQISNLEVGKDGRVYLTVGAVLVFEPVAPWLFLTSATLLENRKGGSPDGWQKVLTPTDLAANPDFAAFNSGGPVRMAPSDPQTLYWSRCQYLVCQSYASHDGGKLWTRQDASSLGPTATALPPGVLSISPLDPNEIYSMFQGDVVRSRDAGQTWERMPGLKEVGIPAFGVTRSKDLVMAGMRGNTLIVSKDLGSTWTEIATVPLETVRQVIFGKNAETIFLLGGATPEWNYVVRVGLQRRDVSLIKQERWESESAANTESPIYVPGAGLYFLDGCWGGCTLIDHYTGRGT